MQFTSCLTLLLLAFSVALLGYTSTIIAPFYGSSVIGEIAKNCLPLLIPILLVVAFRKSASKSIVLLLASAVLFYVTVKNCRPILACPDDLVFPLMTFGIVEIVIFAQLILVLILVHFVEILLRNRRPTR